MFEAPLGALATALLAAAVAGESAEPWDVLVAAGDTMIARWEHDLVARRSLEWPLAEVAPVLAAADAALANLECCAALRGAPAEKGERCPFYYRARPEMLACLASAGIDMVTAANNHVGDYGPEAVAETARWTEEAGLLCVGIGASPEEAERPRLVLVGRTRIALCGLDTTMPRFSAAPGRWGSNSLDPAKDPGEFARRMERLGAWARGRCDLLILTVHWGDNWTREVPPLHRRLARIAFEAGVDLILGHSAHRLQGIEVTGGKAALYDMGNLLFDCELREEGRRSALFRLRISPRGVHRIEALPIEVREGRTVLASQEEARATLEELRSLCAPLGTSLKLDRGDSGRPVGVVEIPEPRATPRPAPVPDLEFARFPRAVRLSPPRAEAPLVTALPEDAVRLEACELAPGIELLGCRLPETASEGGILAIRTWWRVTRRVEEPRLIALELETGGRILRRGSPWYTRHDPGDWLLPFSRMRPGEIVEDLYPARLEGLPAGPCEVRAVILDPRKPEAERTLGPGKMLGSVSIRPASPRRAPRSPRRASPSRGRALRDRAGCA